MNVNLEQLETPALLLDRARLSANCSRMTAHLQRLGVQPRPHLKTAKSIDVARLAVAGGRPAITVSTLHEAEYFAAHGLDDICYAVPITPDKLARAAALIRRGVHLALITDHPRVARELDACGAWHKVILPVFVEVDCGQHRTGVDPESDDLLSIARLLHEGLSTRFEGVLTHAGHAYDCADVAAIRAVAAEERRLALLARDRLLAADLPCPAVSIGSTPTAVFAEDLTGITEVRAGVYMFGDLFQVSLGSVRLGDLALSVLATVTSHREDRNSMHVDAGGLALSKDAGTGNGYGLVADLDGHLFPDVRVVSVNQEHGELGSATRLPFESLPVGSRVRIFPNHACMTAAAYDRYMVLDERGHVIAEWPRTNGWRGYET